MNVGYSFQGEGVPASQSVRFEATPPSAILSEYAARATIASNYAPCTAAPQQLIATITLSMTGPIGSDAYLTMRHVDTHTRTEASDAENVALILNWGKCPASSL